MKTVQFCEIHFEEETIYVEAIKKLDFSNIFQVILASDVDTGTKKFLLFAIEGVTDDQKRILDLMVALIKSERSVRYYRDLFEMASAMKYSKENKNKEYEIQEYNNYFLEKWLNL